MRLLSIILVAVSQEWIAERGSSADLSDLVVSMEVNVMYSKIVRFAYCVGFLVSSATAVLV